jgi:hypothetical protein
MGIVSCWGEVYLFSAWTKLEFDKMQIPLCSRGYTDFTND